MGARWFTAVARFAAAVPLAATATTCAAAATPVHQSAPASVSHGPFLGADISWPNCRKGLGIKHKHTENEPMPEPDARFVIVGVTNGPGFHPNPCLGNQLGWVSRHHRQLGAYALTTYPTPSQLKTYGGSGPYAPTIYGRLKNTGYAEATYNLATMHRVGMKVPMIWVDVEPYQYWPWSSNHKANEAVLRGVIAAYRASGLAVGIYTYANGWAQVVGTWSLPNIPTWNTVGGDGQHAAREYCSYGPSGGATWVSQWYSPHQDFDLVCPAAPTNRAQLFTPPPG